MTQKTVSIEQIFFCRSKIWFTEVLSLPVGIMVLDFLITWYSSMGMQCRCHCGGICDCKEGTPDRHPTNAVVPPSSS